MELMEWLRALTILLGHHLWQGMVLIVLTALVLRAMPRLNSATRYGIWTAAFILTVLLPFLTVASGPEQRREKQKATQIAFSEPVNVQNTEPVKTAVTPGVNQPLQARATPVPRINNEPISYDSKTAPIPWVMLTILWLFGVLWRLAQLSHAFVQTRRLKKSANPLPDADPLLTWFRETASFSGVGNAQLLTSDRITGPMALGLGKPVILVPQTMNQSLQEDDMRRVIHHELAHLRRADDRTNLIQKVGEALFWHHPGIRLAARNMDLEREKACDEWAAIQSGSTVSYADCLVKVYESRTAVSSPTPQLAVGALGNRSQLGRRVDNLLQRRSGMAVSASLPIILVALLLLAAGSLAFALATPNPMWLQEPQQSSKKTNIHFEDSDDHHLIHHDDGSKFEIKGEISFSEDETRITGLSRSGYFYYQQKQGSPRHEIKVTPGPAGVMNIEFKVNGKQRPDAEGQAWLSENLPELLAEMAINAGERIDQLLKDGGIDNVLDFVDGINSEHACSVYFRNLVERAQPDPVQVDRIVARTSRFTSDFQASRIYRRLLEDTVENGTLENMSRHAAKMSSDYERQRVMAAILDQANLSDEAAATLVRAGTEMSSDYEISRFLRKAAEKLELSLLLEAGAIDGLRNLDSDYEISRLARAFLARDDLSGSDVDSIIEATAGIDSDYEIARVLTLAASKKGDPGVYLRAAGNIDSGYERSKCMLALINDGQPEPEHMIQIIETTSPSDSETGLFRVLEAIAEQQGSNPQVREALNKVVQNMKDGSKRKRLERRLDL